jgi:hypothetical protein
MSHKIRVMERVIEENKGSVSKRRQPEGLLVSQR